MGLIEDVLLKAAGIPVAKIIAILRAGAAAVPEFSEDAEAIIAKIQAGTALDNVARIAVLVPTEIANVFQGNIDPRPDQPSNAA
jgi:antitoxin (DNA-binding transcriptional repressor) of toxin-antitoxin stability system